MSDVRLRPMEAADVDRVHAVVRSAETADGLPLATPRDEIQERVDDPGVEIVVAELGDEVVGWGLIEHHPSGERQERALIHGAVHPSHRRRGVGSAVLRWQLDRSTERLRPYDHDLPRFIRTFQYDWVADAIALYEGHGMSAVRWYEELGRPVAELPDVPAPEGVVLVPWDEVRDREDDIRAVSNAAFADHWGTTPRAPDAWTSMLQEYGVRRDLSVVALAGDEVVGYSLNHHWPDEEAVVGSRDGWIGQLGVVRAWRRRGVGAALIVASMAAFGAADLTHAMLGVDRHNPTGAVGLYRRLGFELRQRGVTHELEVEAGA